MLNVARSCLIIGASLTVFSLRVARADSDELSFNRDIRPILAANCLACHGRDANAREADLQLNDRKLAVAAGAIKPGMPSRSKLVERIESTDPEVMMPPPDSGHRLTPKQIQTLRDWVKAGAKYEQHWAFISPVKQQLPSTKTKWSNHPVDRFILKRIESAGLRPNPAADRLRLIRRLSLDLTGLPPTIKEADAFAADDSPQAVEKVVDRLLSSDAFGEHWAGMWLDLARYADTNGYEKDRPRTIWRYRDWVIDALNRDMPYDQFTIEQLAGDLLPKPTMDQLLATAFHRNTMENDEGGTDDEEFRVAAVKDRVDTTVQVWMGLTMGCAKCHSHKYDPISQQDYYAFYAFFNQTEDADRKQPTLPTPTREQSEQIAQLESELTALRETMKEASSDVAAWKKWRAQFDERPLWQPLRKTEFESKQSVQLEQDTEGAFSVTGELPEKDTWTLALQLPDNEAIHSLRIDTLPKDAGGKWSDKNVALRELTVELIESGKEPVVLKMVRPRADFSQRGWEVAKAIDGKTNAGWAFSPKAASPHCAVFDFSKPIPSGAGRQLRLTLEQEYGQGLLLDTFRISTSSYPTAWLTADIDPNLKRVYQRHVDPKSQSVLAAIEKKQGELAAVRRTIPATPILRELASDKQRETRIHRRGNFLDPAGPVKAATLPAFGKLPSEAPQNRLGVSQWLVDANNPLTSRVAVNRVWARLFGTGLVETEEDFGTQGALPSHPALLDWLAVEYRERGWSLKQLLKTIVMSQTYQQSTVVTEAHRKIDPRNRLLSRGARFRLSAEVVRDQSLAVSGLLTRKIGGPSVMPPQPPGIWKSTYSGEKWKNATGKDRYRRALYTYKKRTSPYPAMLTFDAGSGEVCQVRRVRTNTPLQALVTLNDTAYVEAAGALAKRMQDLEGSLQERLAAGFRMVLVRKPDAKELNRLVALYDALGDGELDDAALLKAAGLSAGDARLVAVANVLLNLDETLMKP